MQIPIVTRATYLYNINPQKNKIMSNFNVPTRDEVSENNQAILTT
jgi:hypothetical protein